MSNYRKITLGFLDLIPMFQSSSN